MEEIPDELTIQIINNLTIKDLLNIKSVNKSFHNIVIHIFIKIFKYINIYTHIIPYNILIKRITDYVTDYDTIDRWIDNVINIMDICKQKLNIYNKGTNGYFIKKSLPVNYSVFKNHLKTEIVKMFDTCFFCTNKTYYYNQNNNIIYDLNPDLIPFCWISGSTSLSKNDITYHLSEWSIKLFYTIFKTNNVTFSIHRIYKSKFTDFGYNVTLPVDYIKFYNNSSHTHMSFNSIINSIQYIFNKFNNVLHEKHISYYFN